MPYLIRGPKFSTKYINKWLYFCEYKIKRAIGWRVLFPINGFSFVFKKAKSDTVPFPGDTGSAESKV